MSDQDDSRGYEAAEGPLRVWAVDPYYGGSHKQFLDGLARFSRHRLTLFTLPGRYWKWRMHGGAVTLGQQAAAKAGDAARGGAAESCAREGGGASAPGAAGRRAGAAPALPDLLFVSDMLDLPVFLAVAGPRMARVPALLYFHENQLTYPLPDGVERDLTYGMKNITSALTARTVLFNSAHHRKEFLEGVAQLASLLPDELLSGVGETLRERSRVLPLGCDLRRLDAYRESGAGKAAAGCYGDPLRGPLLLWNQRWEYDKAPGRFFAALRALKERGVRFRLAMAGPNQGTPTAEFLQARSDLADRVVIWGKVESPAEYAELLWASDVVASTAIHEFFGAAVVEAMYAGCRPVLPWRLSYPGLVPEEVHGEVLYREGRFRGRSRTRSRAAACLARGLAAHLGGPLRLGEHRRPVR